MVEFKTIKSIVTSNACVKPFDPQKKTMIYTDGSKLYGAEYVLNQESGQVDDKDEPIQHLIMCNIVTARHEWAGYSLLEVELLALFWGCKDALYYLKGCPVVICSLRSHALS